MRRPRQAEPPPVFRPGGRQRLILDVDTGIDDSLALLYAAGHPDVDLVAVTTCAGNVGVDQVVHNTLGVLELAGATHVEVARGAAGPIARRLEITPETHGPTGTGYAVLEPSGSVSDRTAIEVLVDEARRTPGEITLVTAGPLTNLAAAVLAEPDLPLLLRDVFVMGGTFSQAGNVHPRVEWNIHVDPEAARTVLHQWSAAGKRGAVPITMMGLDVTETSVIRAEDLLAVAHATGLPAAGGTDVEVMTTALGSPVLDFVRDSLRFYFEFHELHDGFYGAHVHDPFVVGAAVDPSLIASLSTVVDVELGGQWTTGETIADWRGHFDKPVNAYVATAGDGAEFIRRLRSVLADLVRVGTS
ncbi:nucleoside hydrolase [Nocardioides sp. cx-173]|uniref:nucleoside hydrolase n=1 Tax=Nocardioides sp. cx-173 TaxID=2898796 RepID=UPI001E35A8C1|nr:nucleoside hydrolase [Nocardioides sp. cx-173]MCD4524041.1 nucleoside hydrolase [Nocardioides sp. cx-173]UGB41442.1 nucleoside hydrolase [Nocardioides sp. cx-173]